MRFQMTQLPWQLLLYLVGRQADEARAVSRFVIFPGQNYGGPCILFDCWREQRQFEYFFR